MRRLAAFLLLASPCAAEVPLTWSNLCLAVSERCESTFYGFSVTTNGSGTNAVVSTNRLYVVEPPKVTQPIVLSLGLLQEGFRVGTNLYPPVICETSGVVMCWTNYVAADNLFFRFTNGVTGEGFFPYHGPLRSTNWLFTTPPDLLSFTNLAATYGPDFLSAAAVWELDEKIYELLENHFWIDPVVMGEGDGSDWFTSYTHTNAFWQDTTNPAAASWYLQNAHPLDPPRLTISNAWKNAGLESLSSFTNTHTITTNIVDGWQAGELTKRFATNILPAGTSIYTNLFTFRTAPTSAPLSLELGSVRIVGADTATGVTFSVTSIEWDEDFGGGSDIELPGVNGDVPLRVFDSAAVAVRWVPSITNTTPPPDFALSVTGLVMTTDSNGIVCAKMVGETVAVSAESTPLANKYWKILSLSSPWTALLSTNGTHVTNGWSGARLHVIYTNLFHVTWSHDSGIIGLSSNALVERWKVVQQMKWSRVAAMSDSGQTGFDFDTASRHSPVWKWTGWNESVSNYYFGETDNEWSFDPVSIGYGTNETVECPDPAWDGAFAFTGAHVFTNGIAPMDYNFRDDSYFQDVWSVGLLELGPFAGNDVGFYCSTILLDYDYDYDGDGDTNSHTRAYIRTGRGGYNWPSAQSVTLTNLTTNFAASVQVCALFGTPYGALRVTPSGGRAYRFPNVVTNVFTMKTAISNDFTDAAYFYGERATNTLTFTEDARGPVTNTMALFGTPVSKAAGNAAVTLPGLQFTDKVPSLDNFQPFTFGYDLTATTVFADFLTIEEHRTIEHTAYLAAENFGGIFGQTFRDTVPHVRRAQAVLKWDIDGGFRFK